MSVSHVFIMWLQAARKIREQPDSFGMTQYMRGTGRYDVSAARSSEANLTTLLLAHGWSSRGVQPMLKLQKPARDMGMWRICVVARATKGSGGSTKAMSKGLVATLSKRLQRGSITGRIWKL